MFTQSQWVPWKRVGESSLGPLRTNCALLWIWFGGVNSVERLWWFVCVFVCVCQSDAQCHRRRGGRVWCWLFYLSICLHPRPFPKEGGTALHSSTVWHYISWPRTSPCGLERRRACSELWGRGEKGRGREREGGSYSECKRGSRSQQPLNVNRLLD